MKEAVYKQEVCNIFNVVYIRIKGDGNCLFRAISFFEYNHQENHLELRCNIIDYIICNRIVFEQYISSNEGIFDDYISNMRKEGIWGTYCEVIAYSKLRNINIHVHILNNEDQIINQNVNNEWLHLFYNDHTHFDLFKQNVNVTNNYENAIISNESNNDLLSSDISRIGFSFEALNCSFLLQNNESGNDKNTK